MALSLIFALIGGWALDRYGPRIIALLMGLFTGLSLLLTSLTNAPWQLFITYSLLLAMGTGAIYIVTMATVSRWFDKKRGLALGIAGSASGWGMLLIAPFAAYLISSFDDWRIAYVVIGLIAWLIVMPLSRLLRKDPHEIGALPDGEKSGKTGTLPPNSQEGGTELTEFSLPEATKTRSFWLFGSIWLLYSYCYLLVATHIVPHTTDVGIPAMEAATVLSLIGGSNIAGRLLVGRVSDSMGRKATAITCALLVVAAMIWLLWAQELWMLYLFAIVWGFSFGGLDPPVTALIGDTFGLRSIGVIMGTLNIAWGIGSAVGPVVGGLVFDVSSDYSLAFVAGAVAMLIVSVLVALIKRETNRNKG
jgi:MFS family permease